MCVRMVIVTGAALLLTGCAHGGASAPMSATTVSSPASVAWAPADTALLPVRDGNPACPTSDAWGKDPTESGILVTVWSDHAEIVTVLVRSKSGVDRAQMKSIDPQKRFQFFEFPDVDHDAVTEVLILSNTRRCYSTMDPATAAG